MRPPIYDLFGQIPVYLHDVDNWLIAVPRIDPQGPRAKAYIHSYDVLGKIRQAKMDGRFDHIITRRERSPFWWQRFHWGD